MDQPPIRLLALDIDGTLLTSDREVSPRTRTVGKADAVAFLQERWGISPAETLAVGDNWNDEEMITRAGKGFIMGNADPELHRMGWPVLPTNDEDGLAEAIETHVLGGKEKRG